MRASRTIGLVGAVLLLVLATASQTMAAPSVRPLVHPPSSSYLGGPCPTRVVGQQCLSIWTDRSVYSIGEIATICYSVDGPGVSVDLLGLDPTGQTLFYASGIDDGGGSCFSLPIRAPAGTDTVRITETCGTGYCTWSATAQATFQIVSSATTSLLTASPTTVIAPSTSTTIRWIAASGAEGFITVSVDGGPNTQIGQGTSGTIAVSWIQPGHTYTFRLYLATNPVLPVAQVTVTSTALTSITASPTTVMAPSTTTTITYTTGDGSIGQVYVSMDSGPDVLVAQGPGGSFGVPWIVPGHTYVFRLFRGTTHTILMSQVTVVGQAGPYVIASPATVTSPSTTTTVTFSSGSAYVDQLFVSMDGGPEVLVAQASGATVTVPWIQAGHTYAFRLYLGTGHTVLLSTAVVVGT